MRQHLRRLKAAVLAGVHVCFTKIIPLGVSEPEDHHLWRMAIQASTRSGLHSSGCDRQQNDNGCRLQLGASCSLSLTAGITHLVAGGAKTEKAVEAERLGIPIVSPDWLYASGGTFPYALALLKFHGHGG